MPVFPAASGPSSLVTVADVAKFLGATAPTDPTVMQEYVDGAQIVVEDIIGHVVPVGVTETHDGGDRVIYLRELPVLSVQSVVEVIGMVPYTLTAQPVGHPIDSFAYTLENADLGRIVRRSAGSTPMFFHRNLGNITVAYTAGRATVTGNVKLGTLELIAQMWRFGHQAYGPASNFVPIVRDEEAEQWSSTPSGYLVPNRVKELLHPGLRQVVFS